MLWELLRYPSGDAHAQLFWRRRMSVLAVLSVILLLVLVLALKGGGGPDVQPTAAEVTATDAGGAPAPSSDPAPPAPVPPAIATPSASATPSPRTSPSATPSPAADAATDCPPGSMALRITSDAPAYTVGRQPVLTLSVVDVGNTPCTVDLGPRSTAISVLSGGKPIWTSNACGAKQQRPTPLSPASAQMLQLRWDLTRNADGCGKNDAPPAPGQYEVIARVGNSAAYGGNFELR